MKHQHQRAIDRLKTHFENDPNALALIICGSVAKGCARDDSDVDFILVTTEDEFEHRLAKKDLFFNSTDFCDYPGGYVDGKIFSPSFLEKIADKGSEPARAAFEGAFTAFSRLPNLNDLIVKIHAYPDEKQEERIRTFYMMTFLHHWFMGEAERHNNAYTRIRATSQLVLFSARLLLAHNRKLYPFHKWLLRAVESVPQKPSDYLQLANQLLNNPNSENAALLFKSICEFRDWGVTDLEAYTQFMTDVEWSWLNGSPPIEDW